MDDSSSLRAGVMGCTDGLVSVGAVLLGVASGQGAERRLILLSGVSALTAGALSMAVCEYISAASQRDAQLACEMRDGAGAGPSRPLPDPAAAGLASLASFVAGGILPLAAAAFVHHAWTRKVAICVATLVGLLACGWLGARAGRVDPVTGAARVLVGGSLALAATYAVGRVSGVGAG